MAPPIGVQAHTVVLSYGGGVRCIWILYTWQRSVEVLLLQIILWYLAVVCFRSWRTDLTAHYAGYPRFPAGCEWWLYVLSVV